MKFLKITLIIVAAIIALLLIIPVFLPSSLTVERSITINKPAAIPFSFVNSMQKWPQWNEWNKIDTAQELSFSGPDYGEGSSYSWKSKNQELGEGSMTIKKSLPDEKVEVGLVFLGKDFGNQTLTFKVDGEKTVVTMSVTDNVGYFYRYSASVMAKQIADMFDKSLANLKALCETSDNINISITTEKVERTPLLAIRDSIIGQDMSGLSLKIKTIYKDITTYMQTNYLPITAPPVVITHFYNTDKFIFSAGFPVANNEIKPQGRIYAYEIPACRAVKANYTGPYEKMDKVYASILKYINDNKLEVAGESWEVYLNDPQTVTPDKLLTMVYFPIK